MLSKEEKNYARKIVLVEDTINRMIDGLFDEVTVKGEFKEGVLEVNIKDFVNEILNEKLKSLFPYKFEDLKKGMWVWDDKHSFYDRIISLHSPTPSSIETETWFTSFEENRFYRRQKEN